MAYRFGEAFMLMWYACQCGHRERIWNSRDGITPFALMCPSCAGEMGTLKHVQWQSDEQAPEHKPHRGQRFFRDGTPDEAEAIMRRRFEIMGDEYPLSDAEAAEIVARARAGTEAEFASGWPMLEREPDGV